MVTATRSLEGSASWLTSGVSRLIRRMFWMTAYLLACIEVARQRRQLLAMDVRALKDIGISRADAVAEAGRDFWDIPEEQKPRA